MFACFLFHSPLLSVLFTLVIYSWAKTLHYFTFFLPPMFIFTLHHFISFIPFSQNRTISPQVPVISAYSLLDTPPSSHSFPGPFDSLFPHLFYCSPPHNLSSSPPFIFITFIFICPHHTLPKYLLHRLSSPASSL